MKKQCKNRRDMLRKELDFYAKSGIDLWLNGSPSTPKKIERAHQVAEEGTYMRDYVEDMDGRLIRIGFDIVKEE